MPKPPIFIRLEQAECARLTFFMNRMALKGNLRAKLRGQAVWLSHHFRTIKQIAEQLNCSSRSVYTWLRRYRKKGLDGLSEPAKPAKLTPEQINQILKTGNYLAAMRSKKYVPTWSYHKTANWVRDQWQITISAERIRQIINKELWASGPDRP
ncbi:MAG: helix-turn-helix domain-containing protein [Planctomycetes bacterium]|nr:helix-turn-helix domain-containing protein [Planctomycetota bacterium]